MPAHPARENAYQIKPPPRSKLDVAVQFARLVTLILTSLLLLILLYVGWEFYSAYTAFGDALSGY